MHLCHRGGRGRARGGSEFAFEARGQFLHGGPVGRARRHGEVFAIFLKGEAAGLEGANGEILMIEEREVQQGWSVVRLDLQGGLEERKRLLQVPAAKLDHAERVVRLGQARVEGEGLAHAAVAEVVLLEADLGRAELEPALGVARVEVDVAHQLVLGGGGLIAVEERAAQVVADGNEIRIERQGAAISADGLRVEARAMVGQPEVIPRLGIFGEMARGVLERLDGGGGFALADEPLAFEQGLGSGRSAGSQEHQDACEKSRAHDAPFLYRHHFRCW